MLADESVNDRAMANKRLERDTFVACDQIGDKSEYEDGNQRQKPPRDDPPSPVWRHACGHVRYIHEPTCHTGGSHRLVRLFDHSEQLAGRHIDGPEPLPYKPPKSYAGPKEFGFGGVSRAKTLLPQGAASGEH